MRESAGEFFAMGELGCTELVLGLVVSGALRSHPLAIRANGTMTATISFFIRFSRSQERASPRLGIDSAPPGGGFPCVC